MSGTRGWGRMPAAQVLLGAEAALLAYSLWCWRADRRLADQVWSEAQPPPRLPAKPPRVSILVAAWNEAAVLQRHLRGALSLRYPDVEYVICAGGDDGTFDIAAAAQAEGAVTLLQLPGEGKQRALRRALAASSGELIFLTDADCVLDDESFLRTLEPILDGRTAASTGGFAPLPEQVDSDFVLHQWAVDVYARARSADRTEGIIGRNAAVRRDALIESRSLEQEVPVGTDYHLARSLTAMGHEISFVRDSAVKTRFHTGIRPYLRQQARWLKNVALHGFDHGAWGHVSAVARGYAAGVAAVLLPLATPVVGRVALVAWLAGLSFAIANRFRYLAYGARARDIPVRPSTYAKSFIYAPLDLAALAYGLIDLTSVGRRRRW